MIINVNISLTPWLLLDTSQQYQKSLVFSDNKLSIIHNIFSNNLDFVTKSDINYDDTSDHFPIFVCCAPQLPPKKVDFHTVFDKSKYEELSSYLTEELQNYTDITD